jgi:hypothetical protein
MKCHLHPDRDAVGYCITCGQGVCAECRREVAGTIRCPNHTAAAAPIAAPPPKSGFLAGLFSIMFPGLGHLYAGAYQRGMRFGGLAVALIVILSTGQAHTIERFAPLFGLSLFFVWAFALFDAIRVAHEINAGTYLAAATPAVPVVRRSGTGTLTFGIILLGLGTLFLADRYIELDRFFDFVYNNIGFIFVALGMILVAAYVRKRNKERDAEVASPGVPADPSTSPNRSFLK